MRKYLIIVLIVILVILVGVGAVKGIKIGKFQIVSVGEIAKQSKDLDSRIEVLNEKNIKNYKSLESELETKYNELKKQKEDYADLILFTTEDDEEGIRNLYEKYEIEYLWTKLGNYATKNGLMMKLEVTKSSSGIENTYNLNFTLNGDYVSIIDCITEIEDDSTLGFKIENFNLIQADKSLQATFIVKEVTINKLDKKVQSSTEQTNNDSTNTNNKNSTTNTTTSNTTNNNINNTVQ